MKRAPNKLFKFDEEGNAFEVTKKDYIKGIVEEFEVKPFESEHQNADPSQVVEHVMDCQSSGMPVPDAIGEEYAEVIERVQSDMKASEDHKSTLKGEEEKAKEEKKKAREAEKEAKEKEAAELAVRQDGFIQHVAEGAESADNSFRDELLALKDALPEGIEITGDKQGFGITIAEGTSEGNIGKAVGELFVREQNSSLLAGQLQFFVGDLANACVEMGIYQSGIKAGKHISDFLAEKLGRKLSGRNVESYGRMAARVPVKFRNPRVDPTAYLAVSDAKMPKKDKEESLVDYAKREKKFIADRNKILAQLGKGEVQSRKDTLPLVEELLYTHGIKERPDPDAPAVKTTGDWLKQFFHASFGLDNLIGVHEEDKASYKFGEEIHHVDKAVLEALKAEAEDNLGNIFYTSGDIKPDDYIAGTKVFIEKRVVGTEADGKKAKIEDVEVTKPVYPDAFFAVAEDAEASE